MFLCVLTCCWDCIGVCIGFMCLSCFISLFMNVLFFEGRTFDLLLDLSWMLFDVRDIVLWFVFGCSWIVIGCFLDLFGLCI